MAPPVSGNSNRSKILNHTRNKGVALLITKFQLLKSSFNNTSEEVAPGLLQNSVSGIKKETKNYFCLHRQANLCRGRANCLKPFL